MMRLRSLAKDPDRLDDFAKQYELVVADIAREMHLCRNTERLLDGLYREQLQAARALLMDQIRWLETQCGGEA